MPSSSRCDLGRVAGVYMESRLRGLHPQITPPRSPCPLPPLSLGTLTLTFESTRSLNLVM